MAGCKPAPRGVVGSLRPGGSDVTAAVSAVMSLPSAWGGGGWGMAVDGGLVSVRCQDDRVTALRWHAGERGWRVAMRRWWGERNTPLLNRRASSSSPSFCRTDSYPGSDDMAG